MEAMICGMTPQERRNPHILNARRRQRIERALHNQYRQRGGGLVYDDDYGTVTEADLIVSADEAFQAYDRAEAEHAKRQPR
jgi:outer membrane PBP1 activator LpoA protein